MKEDETQTSKVYSNVYIPKWGFTKAVTPCFYSPCPNYAIVVEGGKVNGAGVCLFGLRTGRYESLTSCDKRWDKREHHEFLEAFSKIPRDVIKERR